MGLLMSSIFHMVIFENWFMFTNYNNHFMDSNKNRGHDFSALVIFAPGHCWFASLSIDHAFYSFLFFICLLRMSYPSLLTLNTHLWYWHLLSNQQGNRTQTTINDLQWQNLLNPQLTGAFTHMNIISVFMLQFPIAGTQITEIGKPNKTTTISIEQNSAKQSKLKSSHANRQGMNWQAR